MKKYVLRGLIWFLFIILVISVIITAVILLKKPKKQKIEETTSISAETTTKEPDVTEEIIEEEKEEEIPLTMSNVSSVVLCNRGLENDVTSKRAGLFKFFYIPITEGATINIVNNSDEFKYSVVGFSDNLIYDYTGSGWVMPKNATSYTLESGKKYISINIARVDDQDIDPKSIDLSKFKITYVDDSENLLYALLPMAELYNIATLKGYDHDKLSALSQKPTIAHAFGTDIHEEKLTFSALKNAVEAEGFKMVEIDVRETIDNVLVCYHDEILTGTRMSVRYSTFDSLKGANPAIATLEEVLSYCGANNIGVVLDVKDIHSNKAVSTVFSLIEQNNLKENFFFAARPEFLANNMPAEYQSVSYSVYSTWDDSYNGQNNIRCSTRCTYIIELNKLADLLKAGHRSFEFFDPDKSVSNSDSFKNGLSVFMYLSSAFDANYNLTLYSNISIPVLSEKEIICSMPMAFWESLDLINYVHQSN